MKRIQNYLIAKGSTVSIQITATGGQGTIQALPADGTQHFGINLLSFSVGNGDKLGGTSMLVHTQVILDSGSTVATMDYLLTGGITPVAVHNPCTGGNGDTGIVFNDTFHFHNTMSYFRPNIEK